VTGSQGGCTDSIPPKGGETKKFSFPWIKTVRESLIPYVVQSKNGPKEGEGSCTSFMGRRTLSHLQSSKCGREWLGKRASVPNGKRGRNHGEPGTGEEQKFGWGKGRKGGGGKKMIKGKRGWTEQKGGFGSQRRLGEV